MVWIYYIPEEWNIRSKRKQGVRKCRLWRHLCVTVRTYGGRGGERGHEVARAARGHSERRVGLNFISILFFIFLRRSEKQSRTSDLTNTDFNICL